VQQQQQQHQQQHQQQQQQQQQQQVEQMLQQEIAEQPQQLVALPQPDEKVEDVTVPEAEQQSEVLMSSAAVVEELDDNQASTNAVSVQGKDVSDSMMTKSPLHRPLSTASMMTTSSSLASSTLSLCSNASVGFSCSCDFKHPPQYYQQSLSLDETQPPPPIRKTSVPNVQFQAQPPHPAVAVAALLRRGSLPLTSKKQLSDYELFHARSSSCSRRSSSGAIVPLATLKENQTDSDISLEDLSQVSQVHLYTMGLYMVLE
jgi:hypothetical protein